MSSTQTAFDLEFPVWPPPLTVMSRQTNSPVGSVLDPFSGSGTTAAACVELGRRYTGIEINEFYADRSRARLAHETHSTNRAPSKRVKR